MAKERDPDKPKRGLDGIAHRLLLVMFFILYVITGGLSFIVNNLSDDVQASTRAEERLTAEIVGLDETITNALKKASEPGDGPRLDNQAIIESLQAISRIEGHICGGRCPTGGK